MVVVTGYGPLHDGLFAAALSKFGVPSTTAIADEDSVLLGRKILSRGHSSTAHALAGTIASHQSRGGPSHDYVIPGDRCSTHPIELQQALRSALSQNLSVHGLSPEWGLQSPLGSGYTKLSPSLLLSLLRAAAIGDALHAAVSRLRCAGLSAASLESVVNVCLSELVWSFEERFPISKVLRRSFLRELLSLHQHTPKLSVLVVGELYPSRPDGVLGQRVFQALRRPGVFVETLPLSAWILYWLFRSPIATPAKQHFRRAISLAYVQAFRVLGLPPTPLLDVFEEVAALRSVFPVEQSSGSGFLELAAFSQAERLRSTNLLVSLKAFSCNTSSAVSDALLIARSRQSSIAFLPLELDGQAHNGNASRIQLALHVAQQRARDTNASRKLLAGNGSKSSTETSSSEHRKELPI